MAEDIQKDTKIEEETKALKGDIAEILKEAHIPDIKGVGVLGDIPAANGGIAKDLAGVKVSEAPEIKKASIVPPIVSGDISKVIEDVKSATAQKTTGGVVSPTKEDVSRILKEAKLPEKREIRTSGDIPITTVMPHEPPVATDLSGTKEAQKMREKIDPSLKPSSPSGDKDVAAKADFIMPLRTLKDDMSAIVQSSKMSIIRAASLEEEKKSKASQVTSVVEAKRSARRTRHIFAMVFAIIMLFGIGGAALFGVYTITRLQQNTPLPMAGSSILFSEHSLSLVIDGQSPDQIKQILSQARTASTGAIGSITRIVPVRKVTNPDGTVTQQPVTLAEFLKVLGTHAPDDLLRALSDTYFFGIHTVNKNAPVMVIPVLSYSRAFAGMLSWEPSMNADLVPVFLAVPVETRDENGLPVIRTFQDTVMNNYDIRKLTDDQGNIVLYYSFPTTQLLVIAESPYSFVEILSRLQAGRRL